MVFLVAILFVLVAGCLYQARRHQRYLKTIPLRIHVNGIRGKSSVTRLIAGGLRAGGIRTIAKTTGARPRFIYDDGSEVPVVRAGKANIIEQVRIVRRAAQLGAEALVIECMAIKPELQSLLEDRIIRSTHSVITNVRADHLDEMGPTLGDVARNLSRTVPMGGAFFTAERAHLEVLASRARERGAAINVALPEVVSDDTMNCFNYVEHAENVAVALSVCASLGVDPAAALEGMIQATPDPGALRLYHLTDKGRQVTFINGFAINDPDSYVLSWERLSARLPAQRTVVGLATCRNDRMQRSQQIGELVAMRLRLDSCIAAGSGTAPLVKQFKRSCASGRPIIEMEGAKAGEILDRILAHEGTDPLIIFGIGNIVGLGEEIVEQFNARASRVPAPVASNEKRERINIV